MIAAAFEATGDGITQGDVAVVAFALLALAVVLLWLSRGREPEAWDGRDDWARFRAGCERRDAAMKGGRR